MMQSVIHKPLGFVFVNVRLQFSGNFTYLIVFVHILLLESGLLKDFK